MRIVAMCCLAVVTSVAHAEEEPAQKPAAERHVTVEWNARLAAFAGIGGTIGLKPASQPRLRAAIGAFALTLPQFGLDDNKDMGWTVRDRAVLAEGRYYIHRGFYGALFALYQQRTFTKDGVAGDTLVHHYVVAPAVGYEWFPFAQHGFYVNPNFTFAIRVGETGTPELGGATFVEKRFLPLPGINLGWQI